MFPVQYNAPRRIRAWTTLYVLFLFACQGCAHPWIGQATTRSRLQTQPVKSAEFNPASQSADPNQVTVEVETGGATSRQSHSAPSSNPARFNQPISPSMNQLHMEGSSLNPINRLSVADSGSRKAGDASSDRGFNPPACRPVSLRSATVQPPAFTNRLAPSSKPRQQYANSLAMFPPPSGPARRFQNTARPPAQSFAANGGHSVPYQRGNQVVSATRFSDKPQFVTPANFQDSSESTTNTGDIVVRQSEQEAESVPAREHLPAAQSPPPVRRPADVRRRVAPETNPAPAPAPVPNAPQDAPEPITGPVQVPLDGVEPPKNIELNVSNGRVSLVTRNAPVQSVLNLLAEQQGLNLISSDDVTDSVSVTLTDVAFEDALNSIVSVAGCTWTQNRGIILVSKMGGDSKGTPGLQGKVIQVLPLNFVSATDVEVTVKGLLSPLGQVFTSHTLVGDKRRTQELVVVEDIPTSVARITQYIQQIDQPPRQVMIEAHVLQVDLTDNMQHGVDWKFLTTYVGRNVGLNTVGFTNPTASPTSIFSFDGDHLDLVVQALKTTTDAKTLASPKVIVANGQEARIQIGAKLGYFVTTTTQTSTLQNVNFLNTGVLLRVTPQISNDGRVLMVVRPEISTGSISAAGLPQTNTTEAETTVLMEDNGGMIIGGLIKEADSDIQNKVPLLGDMWLIGRLFQQRVTSRQRSEIIIVLIPRIAPYVPDGRAISDIQRATTPLFQNGLQQAFRPGDPRLPDAIKNPRRLIPSRLPEVFANPQRNNPRPLNYYFPTEDEEFNPPEPQFLDLPVMGDPQPEPISQPILLPAPPIPPPAIEQAQPAPLVPKPDSGQVPPAPLPPATSQPPAALNSATNQSGAFLAPIQLTTQLDVLSAGK
ncbi:MAG: hypothetical protein JWM11_2692 [Planctomycetaceae bacterium]|nr:hypothetical protein [Planctomycetaceae bacterium]